MQPYIPGWSSFVPEIFAVFALFVIALLWSVAIKGYALWHAARLGQKKWFIAILLINTIGILEVVYLVWFRTKTSSNKASVISSSPQA